MLIQSAKTRNSTQMTAAKRTSRTRSQSTQKLKTCETTANTGFETRRNDQDLKISSLARFAIDLYGSRQSISVRQRPSAESLLGSPAWSENAWCRRWRFTQVTGLM